MRGVAALGLIVFAAMAASSCSPRCWAQRWADPAVREFYGRPIANWEIAFHNYDFEDQYRIYLYGQLCIHPRYGMLGATFAREGSKVVGPLKQKLSEATDDNTILYTISVFSYMKILNTYDVASDMELMKAIVAGIHRINRPWPKEAAEKDLEDIRK